MIRKLHVVVEVTLLLKGFSLWTKLPPVGKNPRENIASQSVGPFFTVSSITPSFLVRF